MSLVTLTFASTFIMWPSDPYSLMNLQKSIFRFRFLDNYCSNKYIAIGNILPKFSKIFFSSRLLKKKKKSNNLNMSTRFSSIILSDLEFLRFYLDDKKYWISDSKRRLKILIIHPRSILCIMGKLRPNLIWPTRII